MVLDIASIKEAYTKLLIIQYNNKPKAKATIELIVEELYAGGLIFDVQDAFNIETAVGAQLDILGKYIGLTRYYQGQNDLPTAFGFSNAAGDEVSGVEGFSSPADFLTKEGSFLGAINVISSTQKLNDEDYRFLLKLKIVQNTSDHSVKSIDDNLYKFFGTSLYALDLGNMEMMYFTDEEILTLVLVAIQKGVLTRPMGVLINFILISGTYFAFVTPDQDNFMDLEGMTTPDDFSTQEGSFLGASEIIIP